MRGIFHGRLREARIEAGLSQTELARLVGSSPSYISKLENDPFIQVSPEMLQRLAKALEVNVEDVWESPYDKSVGDPSEKLVGAERAILRAYRKLGRKSQNKLLETLNQLNEINEREKRGTKRCPPSETDQKT